MRSLPAHFTVAALAALVPVVIALAGRGKETTKERPAAHTPPEAEATTAPAPAPTAGSEAPKPEPPSATIDTRFLQAAVDRAVAHPEDYEAELELRRLIYALGSGARCIAMLDILNAIPAKSRQPLRQAYRDLFARWAELDPETACKNGIQFHRATGFEGEALAGAFHTFATSDRDAAMEWLKVNGNSFFDHRALLSGAFSEIVEHARGYSTAKELFELAQQLEEDELYAGLTSDALHLWARNVPPYDLMKAIDAMPAGPQRDKWVAEAIAAMGVGRPSSALSYLDKITDPERRAEIAHQVFWPYALTRTPDIWRSPPDPVQNLENKVGSYPIIVFSDAGNALTRHRASAALDKARKIAAGPERDAFVRGMVDAAVFTDDMKSIESAIELASEPLRAALSASLEQQIQPATAP